MNAFEHRMRGHDRPRSDLMGLPSEYAPLASQHLDREPAELPRAGNTALICAAIFAASVIACTVVLKGWPWL